MIPGNSFMGALFSNKYLYENRLDLYTAEYLLIIHRWCQRETYYDENFNLPSTTRYFFTKFYSLRNVCLRYICKITS